MRIGHARADDEPEINLVPLIDVILVLIIFFVVTTTFDLHTSLKLQLPVASAPPAEQDAHPLGVLVNAEGRYFVAGQEVVRGDVDALKRALSEAAGDDREAPVLLRADARTPHQAVVTAYDALAQLGFRRVAIATAVEATP